MPAVVSPLLTVGASHRTASPDLLGEFSRAAERFRADLAGGVHRPTGLPVRELAILSTCARVEIYAVTEDSVTDEASRVVGREVFGDQEGEVAPTYTLLGRSALRHVCRVGAGLDSFVLGEHEISGQVQRALRDAVRHGPDTGALEGVARLVKRASRLVRTETWDPLESTCRHASLSIL